MKKNTKKELYELAESLKQYIPEDTTDGAMYESLLGEIKKLADENEENINKLIRYIAVTDKMDYEEVKEKFEI